MNNEPQDQPLEILESSAIEKMERASIDAQVATAKKYPRVLSVVKAQMLSFATLDTETAAGCFFTLPARAGGDGRPIKGPSIRMAEIAISSFQNIRAGARIIADDGKQITAQGVCHDLQNNVMVTVECRRRVTKKDGHRYSDDMVVMTGNAACSIALRNATFRVVPLALVKPIYEAAMKVAVGDAKTLATRRADAVAHFAKLGVAKEKVFAVVGGKAIEDIGLEQLESLIGYASAIRDGDTSIDEVFNRVEEKPKTAEELYTGKKPPVDDVPMDGKTPLAAAPEPTKATVQMVPMPPQEAALLAKEQAVQESGNAMRSAMDAKVATDATPETRAQGAQRSVMDAGVTLEGLVAEVKARNLALNSETWKSFSDVPEGVWESLANQPKTLLRIIRTFGTKSEVKP